MFFLREKTVFVLLTPIYFIKIICDDLLRRRRPWKFLRFFALEETKKTCLLCFCTCCKTGSRRIILCRIKVTSATCVAGRGFVPIFLVLTPPLKHCHAQKYFDRHQFISVTNFSGAEGGFFFFFFFFSSFCVFVLKIFSGKKSVEEKEKKQQLPPYPNKTEVKQFNQKP